MVVGKLLISANKRNGEVGKKRRAVTIGIQVIQSNLDIHINRSIDKRCNTAVPATANISEDPISTIL